MVGRPEKPQFSDSVEARFLQTFLQRQSSASAEIQPARSSLSSSVNARLGLPRVARVSKRTLAS